MALKRCSACGIEKDAQDFFKHKGGKYGVDSSCKICRTEYLRKYKLEHPEKRKETMKKNRIKRVEKIVLYNKQYRVEHKKEQAAYSREYALKHPECCRERAKKYYKKHPEKAKALKEKWRKENPEKYRALWRCSGAKRRALERAANNCAGADIELMRLIYLYCPEGYQVDHIIPLSKGGLHHPGNLQYLPTLINMQKHNSLTFDCTPFAVDWKPLIRGKEEVTYGT